MNGASWSDNVRAPFSSEHREGQKSERAKWKEKINSAAQETQMMPLIFNWQIGGVGQ